MLILTRKLGEGIRINDDVVIKVVEIRGGQVRLGVEAPRSIPVHREEVYESIRVQNTAAADSTPTSLNDLAALWQRRDESKG